METPHISSKDAPAPDEVPSEEVLPGGGLPDGSTEAGQEEPADLNLLYPDSEQDLNVLFPEREFRELLEKVHKSKRDLDRMNGRLVKDPEHVVPYTPEDDDGED